MANEEKTARARGIYLKIKQRNENLNKGERAALRKHRIEKRRGWK